jgi:hypothetical protein
MANPKVRPHLQDYPRDAGKEVSEACEAERWLHDVPNELTTPMARISSSDFFIYEPAMLRDRKCCIPVRWFTKKSDNQLYAQCWEMQETVLDGGPPRWRVVERTNLVVCASQFLKNLPELQKDAASYRLPDPTDIIGEFIVALVYKTNY